MEVNLPHNPDSDVIALYEIIKVLDGIMHRLHATQNELERMYKSYEYLPEGERYGDN